MHTVNGTALPNAKLKTRITVIVGSVAVDVDTPPTLVAGSDKIHLELGWTPNRPKLEQIIEDAWKWQMGNKDGRP